MLGQHRHASATPFEPRQCGILTNVDSDEPLQPPFKLTNSKCCSVSSLTVIELSRNFAGRTYHIVGNLMLRLKCSFFSDHVCSFSFVQRYGLLINASCVDIFAKNLKKKKKNASLFVSVGKYNCGVMRKVLPGIEISSSVTLLCLGPNCVVC